jgi:DNA-binding MarR family transcriptional regulator
MKNLLNRPRHTTNGAVNGHAPRAPAGDPSELFLKVARDLLYVDDSTSDLPLRQLRVCTALLEGPRSMSELSRELRVSLSAMTQIADRLERAGFATRHTSGDDRRVRRLELTPRGLRAMRSREQARAAHISEVFLRLSPADRTQVTSALETLRRACSQKNGAIELVS